jgi:Site-specific recombinase XerD
VTFDSRSAEADEYAWMRWKLVRAANPDLLDDAEPGRIRVNPTICAPLLEDFPILVDDESGEVNEPVLYFLRNQHVDGNGKFFGNTVWSYAEDLKDWFRFLDVINVKWTNVRVAHLKSYCAVMERTESPHTGKVYSSNTINRRLATINSFYGWARVDGFTPENGELKPSPSVGISNQETPPAQKKS